MRKMLMALLCLPMFVSAATSVSLDRWPGSVGDKAALQNGAKYFVNYCLNCHSASYMRYTKLGELGLTEQQIRDNLMFTAEKIGEPMRVAARPDEQKKWFGAAPPDLTVIARARASADGSGADWLYTYLRSFYHDEKRPTGWNNKIFENVGMPHVLYELQGTRILDKDHQFQTVLPGKLTDEEFDKAVSDLVGFLVWMAEPHQEYRQRLGLAVLAFLVLLFGVAYALKKEYWKDVR